MANLDAPQGFTPMRHMSGGVIRANAYEIANGSGTSIFTGDAVQLLTNGTITLMANTLSRLAYLRDASIQINLLGM